MSTLLEVKNLKTYFSTREGTVKAVDGISYDVNPGETIGIVGESGCGKSVSALSILRLIPDPPGKIVGGELIFEGRDLLKLSEKEIRSFRGNEIAMIFQEPMTSLNPVLTIGRQISEPMELHRGMVKGEALRESIKLLESVQIPAGESRIGGYPHQFSGGMRQRVMIAMAISCSPKLLIADEPTTAIDVTIQAQLLELMKALTRDTGTALIIITHNLGVVARYADRVNVMYAGRIVEQGTADDIYHDPRHPYTMGLLKSVPRLDETVKEKLIPVEGIPPDLTDIPKGCAFNPRCTYAFDQCFEETPILNAVGNGHYKACWADVSKKQ
ncbi:MAG: ABC transporter ATP-binding protein [Candidatus Adiutricales bacterium]